MIADGVVFGDAVAAEAIRNGFSVDHDITVEIMWGRHGVERVDDGLLAPGGFVRVPVQHGGGGEKATGVPGVFFSLRVTPAIPVRGGRRHVEETVGFVNQHIGDKLLVLGIQLIPENPGGVGELPGPHCRLPRVSPGILTDSSVNEVVFGNGAKHER